MTTPVGLTAQALHWAADEAEGWLFSHPSAGTNITHSKTHVLMAVPRLGLDGRKRVLGQIHPKALSDASVVNVPLLYIFEFSILWHAAMSCWEARNNIIPRTVNTPILSPLSHMPASGRDLCLPGLSQCRDASPFLLRFPEQPAKGLLLRNSTPGKFLPIRSEESHSRG